MVISQWFADPILVSSIAIILRFIWGLRLCITMSGWATEFDEIEGTA